MIAIRFFISSLIFLTLLSCRSTRPVIEIGGYSFLYKGKEYRIESVTPSTMEGYNVLTRKDGDELSLKAIDKEQDGNVDEILFGKMSLAEANTIYMEGLLEGERRDHIKKRTFAREYKTSDQMYEYVLDTYVLAVGDVYNRLTISPRESFRTQAVVRDLNADGLLDDVEKGPGTLGGYQKTYEQILEKGIRENRVEKTDSQYWVVQ